VRPLVVTALWVSSITVATAVLYRSFVQADRASFTPGRTSNGHYQIEDRCELCHTPFDGVRQDACAQCHADELEAADDSHPAAKFRDPRNADRLARIDARRCATCHVEHRPAFTSDMSVTQPGDYCSHCHGDIAEERASHRGMGFDTCAAAGCHNFHDNRSLTADYLRAHADEPDLKARPAVPTRGAPAARKAGGNRRGLPAPDGGPRVTADVAADWAASAHARAGVNCSGCHGEPGDAWLERPDHDACRACHDDAVAGFLAGRHGMRLAQDLSPMSPALARQPMRTDAANRAVNCQSCHGAHRYDTAHAAVDACLECHSDEHSASYRQSPHARARQLELQGAADPGSGVSCATCHLPRVEARDGSVAVQHNQNDNLRPNEKMNRSACAFCHGLRFTLDALADRDVVNTNFAGPPTVRVPSIDMVVDEHR